MYINEELEKKMDEECQKLIDNWDAIEDPEGLKYWYEWEKLIEAYHEVRWDEQVI